MLRYDHPDYAGSPDMSPEFYETLGRMSAAFSELETTVFYSVLAMAEGNWLKSATLIARLSTQARLDALNVLGLLSTRDDAEGDKLKNLIAEISAVEQERNRLIHSTHGPIEGDPSVVRMQKIDLRRASLKISDGQVTIEEIRNVASRMWSLNGRLMGFIWKQYEEGNIRDESGNIKPGFYE